MKTRLAYIDQLKGLAMMMVIVGHIIGFCGLGWNNGYMDIITMIQMPLFIFTNGLVIRLLQNGGGGNFLRKKFLQLIIPFLSWGALITIYRHQTYVDFLADLWKFGYWYLIVLFELFVIYWLISITTLKCQNNKRFDFLVFAGLTLFGFLIIRVLPSFIPNVVLIASSYYQLSDYYPYFFVGVIIKRYNLTELLLKNPSCSTTPIYAILALMLVLYGLCPDSGWILIALRISIIMAIYIVFLQTRLLGDAAIKRHSLNFLALVGRHSLVIYMVQFFLFSFIDYHALFAMLDTNPLILLSIAIVTSIAMCYLCIFVEKIILLSRPLSALLLGKPFRRC